MNKSAPILGVEIDLLTFQETVEIILRWCHEDRATTRQVATVNPEFLIRSLHDPAFRAALNGADLRTADGIGIRFAGEFLTQAARRSPPIALIYSLLTLLLLPDRLRPFPEVVTGSDLTAQLLRRAATERLRIYLVGGDQPTMKDLLTKLHRQLPELFVAGEAAGLVDEAGIPKDQLLVSRIAAFKPHLLFVAFGAPKQDRFIARYQHELQAKVAIGIGGTFAYLTGSKPRAPQPMRRRGFEWLWRLLIEPSRWQRILTATVRFVHTVYRSR